MAAVGERTEAFKYIGGQDHAVTTLKAIVHQEQTGDFVYRKPLVLILGPAGFGKTVLISETARALNAGLVSKSAINFLTEGAINLNLFQRGYEEARHTAGRKAGGKVVYALERIDVMMSAGMQPLMSDIVSDHMTNWSEDLEGGVLVMASASQKEYLLPSVLSRFTVIELTPPNKAEVRDMLTKGIKRLSRPEGREGTFAEIKDFESLAEKIFRLGWSPRDITNFLRKAITLKDDQGSDGPIDSDFLDATLPQLPKRLGFTP